MEILRVYAYDGIDDDDEVVEEAEGGVEEELVVDGTLAEDDVDGVLAAELDGAGLMDGEHGEHGE